jgi:hypothetical protein
MLIDTGKKGFSMQLFVSLTLVLAVASVALDPLKRVNQD